MFFFKGNLIYPMQFPSDFLDSIKRLRPDDFDSLIGSLNTEAVTSVRLHPSKGIDLAFLNEAKIEWCEMGRYLDVRPYFTHDPFIHAGAYYVQEASSMFLEQLLGSFIEDIAHPLVLDLCAAPGGKSTHILSMLGQKGLLVSNEIVPNRNAVLRENITKWGYSNVVVTQNEAIDFAKSNLLFDVIVVDAPCSGEGMFRKDKNAIGEWSIENVHSCVVRQKDILDEIIKSLKPGGLLIYSTCTFEPDENINQIERLIQTDEFEPYTLEREVAGMGIENVVKNNAVGYAFYPHKVRGEGFFIGALIKKGRRVDEEIKAVFLKEKIPANVQDFVEGENIAIKSFKEEFHLVSPFYENYSNQIRNGLRVKKEGVNICTQKGKDLIPAPELAFSMFVSKNIPRINIPVDQVIRFLKCENIHFPNVPKGWYLICYQNLGLGWSKVMESRTNNYFPSNWRILK